MVIADIFNMNQKIFNNRKIREDLHRANRIKVVKLLKPLLYLYLPGILSCNPFRKREYWYKFKKGVKKFLQKNPTFGRIIRRKRSLRITTNLNYLAIPRRSSNINIAEETESSDSDTSDDSFERAVQPVI